MKFLKKGVSYIIYIVQYTIYLLTKSTVEVRISSQQGVMSTKSTLSFDNITL